MKIWNQSSKDKDSAIDDFLSGEDIVLDQELFLYDIEASMAHAHELENINILTKSETKKVIVSLKKLAKLFLAKKFKLTSKYEDCHSAIEDYLTKELGSGEGSFNILLAKGSPKYLVNVHLDTVPAGDAWKSDPYDLIIENGKAIGLGACDIKGAAACLLTLLERGMSDYAILFSTDEEAGQSTCVKEYIKTKVITILNHFFQLVRPNNVFFGLKDYQQYLIVRSQA